jgi:hypothetical protein
MMSKKVEINTMAAILRNNSIIKFPLQLLKLVDGG